MDYQVKVCQKQKKTYYMEEIPQKYPKKVL